MLSDLFFDIGVFGVPVELQPVPWVIAALWVAFIIESVGLVQIPNLIARDNPVGIVTVHLGHGDLAHLISNTIGLTVLLALFFLYQPDPIKGLAMLAAASGALYWALGPSRVQVRGASLLLYAVAGWWVVFSFASGRLAGLAVVTFALFVYGIFDAMNPFQKIPGVSVMGHFWGFVAGLAWAAWSLDLFSEWRTY